MREQNRSQGELAQLLGRTQSTVSKLLRDDNRELKARERDVIFEWLDIKDDGPPAIRRVKVIGRIAAGGWREAEEEYLGWMWCDSGGPRTFGLRVEGDSMDRIVKDGGFIAVDPDDRALVNGRLYAVHNGEGATTFKQFVTDDQGARLVPMSNNPAHHELVIGEDSFRIIGRVVWTATRQ